MSAGTLAESEVRARLDAAAALLAAAQLGTLDPATAEIGALRLLERALHLLDVADGERALAAA